MTTYRLFPATNGPGTAADLGGNFIAGVSFTVATSATWFQGYWWWVCPGGPPTGAQKFTLWAVYNTGGSATVVTAATVTSGP